MAIKPDDIKKINVILHILLLLYVISYDSCIQQKSILNSSVNYLYCKCLIVTFHANDVGLNRKKEVGAEVCFVECIAVM